MTNLEAIQSSVAGYPLNVNVFHKALTDRGIAATDTYSGINSDFELATADIYMVLATAANISEGGFSASISDKQAFVKRADAIYMKWSDGGGSAPKVRNATNRW